LMCVLSCDLLWYGLLTRTSMSQIFHKDGVSLFLV
jgi:hypothetical protein